MSTVSLIVGSIALLMVLIAGVSVWIVLLFIKKELSSLKNDLEWKKTQIANNTLKTSEVLEELGSIKCNLRSLNDRFILLDREIQELPSWFWELESRKKIHSGDAG